MPARIPNEVRDRIHELAAAGASSVAIATELGLHRSTVMRIRAEVPFGATAPHGPAHIPPAAWNADQPPPPPEHLKFDPEYHGRTFRAAAPPISFDGWDVERIRDAVSYHDQGFFLESSSLAVVVSRFGPVFAALSQAIAPALALPRHVLGGTRGLSRILREAVEEQLAPRAGLIPSPYFPPTLWGSMALDLRLMGFAVLQHVYGDEDPETGVRPIYTRRWPTWAVQYYRYRRTFVALTTDGPVDIISGDGKFTLVADTEEPHFDGAIRALGLEVLDGSLVKQARASYVDRYGNPKWIGIMPDKVAVRSPEGDAMFDAMATIQGPNGWGVLPHGADFKTAEMSSSQGSVFKDSLDNVWMFCAAIILGSDGTMSKGTGVYSAPIFAGVRRDLVDRMLKAMVRGVNMGHVAPWLDFNYEASIAAASGWTEPVLSIPLPDPDADARIKSHGERLAALIAQVKAERDNGFAVTQERVDQLAASFDVEPPTLRPEWTSFDPSKAAPLLELAHSVGLQPTQHGVAAILEQAGLGAEALPSVALESAIEPEAEPTPEEPSGDAERAV